jgi:hypothetical protein
MNEFVRWISDLQSRIERLESLESGESRGTWFPLLGGLTTNGTITYTIRAGRYVRHGTTVIAYGDIVVDTVSVSPTGTLTIRGLPFAAASNHIRSGNLILSLAGIQLSTNYTSLGGQILATEQVVRLVQSRASDGAILDLPGSALANGDTLRFTAIYEA